MKLTVKILEVQLRAPMTAAEAKALSTNIIPVYNYPLPAVMLGLSNEERTRADLAGYQMQGDGSWVLTSFNGREKHAATRMHDEYGFTGIPLNKSKLEETISAIYGSANFHLRKWAAVEEIEFDSATPKGE